MSIEKGGSKPDSNEPENDSNEPENEKEDEKSSEFKYEDDKIGSSHFRTKDGRVPTDEELMQYVAEALRTYKSVQQQIAGKEEKEEKEEKENDNQQQNKK